MWMKLIVLFSKGKKNVRSLTTYLRPHKYLFPNPGNLKTLVSVTYS